MSNLIPKKNFVAEATAIVGERTPKKNRKLFGLDKNDPVLIAEAKAEIYDSLINDLDDSQIESLLVRWSSTLSHRHPLIPQSKFSTKIIRPVAQLNPKQIVVLAKQRELLSELSKRIVASPEMGLADFVTCMASMPQNFSVIANSVNDLTPVVLETAGHFNNMADTLGTAGKSTQEAVSSVFTWLDQVDSSLYMALGMFVCLYSLQAFKRNPLQRSMLIIGCTVGITVVGKMALANEVGAEAIGTLISLMSTPMRATEEPIIMEPVNIEATPEIGIDLIGDVVRILTTCLTVYISTESGVNIPTKLFKNFTSMDRVSTTVTESLTLFLQIIESVTNYIREHFLSTTSMSFFHANSTHIDSYLDNVRAVLRQNQLGKLTKDAKNLQILEGLVKVGQEITSRSIRDRYSSGVLDMVRKEINNLNTLVSDFHAAQLHLRGLRQEPVAVMFGGGAGTGKSVAMQHLCAAVMGRVLTDAQYEQYVRKPSDFVFNRQAEAVYWDGMECHSITTFDDFGQAIDVAGSPDNEYMNWIRAVNTNEYDMHAARLDLKGNAKFHSKFVFGTTNRKEFRPESIFSSEALTRRIDFNLLVVPKPEFTTPESRGKDLMNRKLDRSKLPRVTLIGDAEDISSLTPGCQHYYVVDIRGDPTGEVFDFDGLVNAIEAKFHEKRRWHELSTLELMEVAQNNRPSYPQMGEVEILSLPAFLDPDMKHYYAELRSAVSELPGSGTAEFYTAIRRTSGILWGSVTFTMSIDALMILLYVKFYEETGRFSSVHELKEFCNYHIKAEFFDFISMVDLDLYLEKPPLPSVISRITESVSEIYKTRVLPGICGAVEYVKKNPLLVLGITAVLGLVLKAYNATPEEQEFVAESYGSETKQKKGAAKPRVKSLRTANPEISHTKNHADMAEGLEKKNMFQLFGTTTRGEIVRFGYVTIIVGKIAIIPNHFIKVFEAKIRNDDTFKNHQLTLSKEGYASCHKYVFSVGELLSGVKRGVLEANDLTLVRLPDVVQPARDIRAFLVNEKDLDTMTHNISFDLRLPGNTNRSFVGTAQPRDKHLCVSSKETGSYTVRYQYEYPNYTKSGDCGGLFSMIRASNGTRVIAGFHVASCSSLNRSYAAAVCYEDIEEDLKLFTDSEDFTTVVDLGDLPRIEKPALPEGRFEYVGQLSPCPTAVTCTTIKRSPLYGMWGNALTDTALLRPSVRNGVELNPLFIAHGKYGFAPTYIDPVDVRIVCNDFLIQLGTTHPLNVREYTVEECIYGDPLDPAFPAVPADTSAGYPMNIQGNRNLKKELSKFEKGSEEALDIVEEIKREVSDCEKLYEIGTIPQWVFTDNLKDERRPFDKLLKGSTRKFSGVPYIYLLLLRKYFGSFMVFAKEGRIKNSMCSGINAYSNEWTEVVEYLSEFTPTGKTVQVGAGDFSAFDGHQLIPIHQGILYIINQWYTTHGLGKNNHIRSRLYNGILNSLHVSDGMLFYILGNMSSGVFGTTTFNSMYNAILFRLAFRSVARDEIFDDHVRVVTFGDDNIFSVSDHYAKIFNELSMPKLMSQFGQVYTREDKGNAVVPLRDISEIDFLKRSFIFDKTLDRYVAPLKLEVILEIPYWTKKGSRDDQITIDNVAAALRELSLHDRKVFDLYSPQMREALMFAYPGCKLPDDILRTYDDLRALVCSEQSWIF